MVQCDIEIFRIKSPLNFYVATYPMDYQGTGSSK